MIKLDDTLYKNWKLSPNPDTEAALYRAMKGFAKALVWNKLGPPMDEDLVSEIVVMAFQKEPSFDGRSKFSTWFYRLAVNKCKDRLKHLSRLPRFKSLDDLTDDEPRAKRAPSVAKKLDIEKLKSRLKPRERQLLDLKLKGLDDQQIADRMGIGKKRSVHVAWWKLKKKLTNDQHIQTLL